MTTKETFPQEGIRQSPEVTSLPELRFSCASSVRIADNEGRLMLLLNKNRAKQGERVFLPVGGGIEASEAGRIALATQAGIDPTSFEKGMDLRFASKGAAANPVREWFLRREEREVSPMREIAEELTDEHQLLSHADLNGITGELAGYGTELAETKREGQQGRPTLRMLEVFDATLPAEALLKLKAASEQPDSVVYFATSEEIMNGVTNDGAEIPSAAQALLVPQPTIEEFQ